MNPKIPQAGALGSTKHRKSQINQSEKEVAHKLGGLSNPASGALPNRKGDMTLDSFVGEQKETVNDSHLVTKGHLIKIDHEATAKNKKPFMIYKFSQMPPGVSTEWVLIPIDIFQEFLELTQSREK